MPAAADTSQLRAITELLERLHRQKDAAYGDAWRKRGEVIGIFANIARKYDRLLIAFDEERPAATEPLGDTVADLCIYAGKYLTWIADEHPVDLARADLPVPDAGVIAARLGPDALRAVLSAVPPAATGDVPTHCAPAWARVRETFEALEAALMAQATPEAPSDQLLDFTAKARLAWALTIDSAVLLACLEVDDPRTLAGIRDEVAAMDRAGAQP
jgi:hypothetical protein